MKILPRTQKRLHRIETDLRARGAVSIHFVWSPKAHLMSKNKAACGTIRFLRAFLDGRTRPALPVGDSKYLTRRA